MMKLSKAYCLFHHHSMSSSEAKSVKIHNHETSKGNHLHCHQQPMKKKKLMYMCDMLRSPVCISLLKN